MAKIITVSSGRKYCSACSAMLDTRYNVTPSNCPECGVKFVAEGLKTDALFFPMVRWGLKEQKKQTL
jgi:predicted RNA-binding Zn-ribbon protein involved in translation (DUF1610 family)